MKKQIEGLNASKTIQKLLQHALEHSGGSKIELSRRLKIRVGTVAQWYRGSMPSLRSLMKLEKYVLGSEEK